MKTLGQIAFEAFYFDRVSAWDEARDYERERWERTARAVVFAQESTDRRSTECEGRVVGVTTNGQQVRIA
jgi:hypothetical protein